MFFQRVPYFPPILTTERLILRPILARDADAVFEYASDPEVTRYLTWECHKSIRESRAYIRSIRKAYRDGSHYHYAITLKEDGTLIGAGGSIRDVQEGATCTEIGYVLNRKYWGQGYATEAMAAVLRFFFEEKGLHRVEGCHVVQNEASGRVLQKLGMSLEGTLQDKYYFKGRYWTVRLYAIINPNGLARP